VWPALFAVARALDRPTPPSGSFFDASTLSPLVLLVAAVPALWYLSKARRYGWVVVLALTPMILASSCVGMSVALQAHH